jgi:hypothetical protein
MPSENSKQTPRFAFGVYEILEFRRRDREGILQHDALAG